MSYTCVLYYCLCRAIVIVLFFFFFSSRRRHTRSDRDWSSDVCSSDLAVVEHLQDEAAEGGGARRRVGRGGRRDRKKREQAIAQEIGRASLGKECRSRWSPYH